MQILLNNFLYDLSQLTIPTDNVDASYVAQPRKWDMRLIQRFMFGLGPISSLYDFLTFGDPAVGLPGWAGAVSGGLVHRVARDPDAGDLRDPHGRQSVPQPAEPRPASLSVFGSVLAGLLVVITPFGAGSRLRRAPARRSSPCWWCWS